MRKAPFWSYLDPFWRFRALFGAKREKSCKVLFFDRGFICNSRGFSFLTVD